MKGKFRNQYRTPEGVLMFVFAVTGTKQEIEKYKQIQGENLRYEDDDETKSPLYFTSRFPGQNIELAVSRDESRVFVDTSKADQMVSLAGQYAGTPIGAEIAKLAAAEIFAGAKGVSSNATPEPVKKDVDADADQG